MCKCICIVVLTGHLLNRWAFQLYIFDESNQLNYFRQHELYLKYEAEDVHFAQIYFLTKLKYLTYSWSKKLVKCT